MTKKTIRAYRLLFEGDKKSRQLFGFSIDIVRLVAYCSVTWDGSSSSPTIQNST
jgi:hypothetical protein